MDSSTGSNINPCAVRNADHGTNADMDVEAGKPAENDHENLRVTRFGSEHHVTLIHDHSSSPLLSHGDDATASSTKFAADSCGNRPKEGQASTVDPEHKGTIKLPGKKSKRSPEQQLTRLALELGVLEKTASQLGMMAFVWATVVLLGGFIAVIRPFDFWVVSAILLTEGARVSSRSHELEWQHAASLSISVVDSMTTATSIVYSKSSKAFHRSEEALRSLFTHRPHEEQKKYIDNQPASSVVTVDHQTAIFPETGYSEISVSQRPSKLALFGSVAHLFDAGRISTMLYYLQLLSAGLCIGLSIARLVDNRFVDESNPAENLRAALIMFYSLALAEALIFLIERGYWEFKINVKKLLVRVHGICQLHKGDLAMVKQFFYDVYSKCLNGSVFDGLGMDFVEYSIEKVHSDVGSEQVGSVRILSIIITQKQFSEDAMRRIETTPKMLPRLLEMLTWKKTPEERDIQQAAAQIIACLAYRYSNRFRIVAIPGAIEGILSLVVTPEERNGGKADQLDHKKLKLLGLDILRNLAEEDTNQARLGRIHGLIPAMVFLIGSSEDQLKEGISHMTEEEEECLNMTIRLKALQVLRSLSSASGLSGKILRQTMSEAVFLLANLRDILRSKGQDLAIIQEHALDIVASLTLDEKLKESMGCTGGIIRSLLALFLQPEQPAGDIKGLALRQRAGKALNLLLVNHSRNCHRLLCLRPGLESPDTENNNYLPSLHKLVELIFSSEQSTSTSAVRVWAVEIVRSICRYKFYNENDRNLMVSIAPRLLKKALTEENADKMQEATLGLAAAIIDQQMQDHEYSDMINSKTHKTVDLRTELLAKIKTLMQLNLMQASRDLPEIRRHVVELITALIVKDKSFVGELKKADLEQNLEKICETTSEVENFYTSSGILGLNRHIQTMEELVEIVKLQLLR